MLQWHALDRSEQSKYYDMARKEKELHMQLYPGWSARDNYALHSKKKKRKREPHTPDNRGRSTTHFSTVRVYVVNVTFTLQSISAIRNPERNFSSKGTTLKLSFRPAVVFCGR